MAQLRIRRMRKSKTKANLIKQSKKIIPNQKVLITQSKGMMIY